MTAAAVEQMFRKTGDKIDELTKHAMKQDEEMKQLRKALQKLADSAKVQAEMARLEARIAEVETAQSRARSIDEGPEDRAQDGVRRKLDYLCENRTPQIHRDRVQSVG